jgi:phospholipid/cholesterol/gamma-HCH transport system ATP-binding protein
MIASGPPKQLLAESRDPKVIRFLTRGETENREENETKNQETCDL